MPNRQDDLASLRLHLAQVEMELEQHRRLCLAELGGDGVWPCGCHELVVDSDGTRKLLTAADGELHQECEAHEAMRARLALMEQERERQAECERAIIESAQSWAHRADAAESRVSHLEQELFEVRKRAGCVIEECSSRMCELGSKMCNVRHVQQEQAHVRLRTALETRIAEWQVRARSLTAAMPTGYARMGSGAEHVDRCADDLAALLAVPETTEKG